MHKRDLNAHVNNMPIASSGLIHTPFKQAAGPPIQVVAGKSAEGLLNWRAPKSRLGFLVSLGGQNPIDGSFADSDLSGNCLPGEALGGQLVLCCKNSVCAWLSETSPYSRGQAGWRFILSPMTSHCYQKEKLI